MDVTWQVTLSTNLFSGGVEVYLSSSATPTAPSHSPDAYTWSGRRIVLSPETEGYCTDCVYTVGVRGTTSARFSILYTLDDSPIALQQGQATAFLTAPAGEALTFTYTLDVPAELTISVTPTSGECSHRLRLVLTPLVINEW